MRREPQNLLQDGTGDKPADVLFGSFYHGRDLCVARIDIHKKIRDPHSFFTHKRQISADRCRTAGKLFAVCAFEVSRGIHPPEISSGSIVVFLKDRIFLTRLHKPASISVLQRSYAYSISLQSTAAIRGS
jgi:hypothetical protein